MKKLLTFACCLLSFSSAVAAPLVIDPDNNPGTNVLPGLTVPSGGHDNVRIVSGAGLSLGDDGLTATSLYVGQNSGGTGTGLVFIETTADNSYTVRSDGDVSITSLLQVLSGHSLGLAVKSQGETIDSVSIGTIDAIGALVIQDVNALSTGSVSTGTALNLSANTVTVGGTLSSSAGSIAVNTTNIFSVTGDVITNGTTNISAGSMSVGGLQNQTGSMTIVSGAIAAGNNWENLGTLMDVTGTDMVVNGTVQNGSNNGTMTMSLNSLRVNGGSGNNASFVNKGDLGLVVAGETNLANGFDLSAMAATNGFSLKTGTLVMGGNADSLAQVFENNKLTMFELVVNNGSITANNITNGSENAAANMTLSSGNGISASTIQNRGNNLVVSTIEGSNANIVISGADTSGTSIFGTNWSTTHIVADAALSAAGAVSNAGTMILNGNQIELVGVSNSGALTIVSQTDATGQIHLSGGVMNTSGTTNISARQVAIDGVVESTGGTATVRGSDANSGASVAVGGIKATGGIINLDALIGSATITGDLLTTNGAFNVGPNTYELNVNGGTQIGGNLTFSATNATGAGNVNVANSGVNRFVLSSAGQIDIDGNVVATDSDVARTGTLVADVIEIAQSVSAANLGSVAFGDANSSILSVAGDVTASNGGTVEIYSADTTLRSLSGNGKFIMHGDTVSATGGGINISNGIWYDGTNPANGMIINGTDALTLQTTATNQDISVAGGMSIANGILNIISAKDIEVSGVVNITSGDGELTVSANSGSVGFNNAINVTDGGAITVSGSTVTTGAISIGADSTASIAGTANANSVTTTGLVSNAGDLDIVGKQITMSSLQSTGGTTDVTATGALGIASVEVSDGNVLLNGATINSSTMELSGGTTKLSSNTIAVTGDVDIENGDLNQGGTVGVLVVGNSGTFGANNLTVDGGRLVVDGNNVVYNITNNATFANGITGNAGVATINANEINAGGAIINGANLTLNTVADLNLGAIQNTGTLVLNTTGGTITGASLANNSGTVSITSDDMALTGALTASGVLYQNKSGAISSGGINIVPADYSMTVGNLTVGGINQNASKMTILSSDVTVNGNIVANDLRIQANPSGNWANVAVSGNVSGGVDFVGLEHMSIVGNYTYNDNSMLHVAVLPTPGVTIDTTTYNYWSTVSLAEDSTFGQITNAAYNAAPLVSVGGNFIYNVSNVGGEISDQNLISPQMGIDIFDMVDSGTAIWLLYADGAGGLVELSDKIRNLNVNFCNADGSRCFKYFDNAIAENVGANQTESGLPAYLSVRDVNQDGITDSIYVVFDSRFGGPVELFKIQPIVDRVVDHTGGEHDAAGALDDMIAGGLLDAGFYNRAPIEAMPVSFRGTNLEELVNELYKRMERYTVNPDGTALARFSRLVQPREVEQVAGTIALNEHTNFRDFADHMLDEFIWNRNRALRKAWADVNYGLVNQDIADGERAHGNRFSVVGGYDWQHSSTLILGVAGRISHTTGDYSEKIDLSYMPGENVVGNVDFDVADTNVGLGAYLMKTLGTKARLYGNGFLDLHLLDVSRDQSFVSHIDGSGTTFSLISEWGLLHDWLNQYIVGNLYARIGYNSGFSFKERAGGGDYMHLKSDGYIMLTPGYSLIAQKRIYPSSWFQIRPYVSVGIEYDVLGAPDYAKFKFSPAKSYTRYGIEIDPLWANIGGGVELLSATGIQVGLDYRYQYNNDIQLHKVRLSGLYRF